ncbi:hypothetical protein C0J52_24966 [Blattella germanica]|nr:hypothetical protein C0J52_24966 [Blattella germanica]
MNSFLNFLNSSYLLIGQIPPDHNTLSTNTVLSPLNLLHRKITWSAVCSPIPHGH